jgi:hypothetical protein
MEAGALRHSHLHHHFLPHSHFPSRIIARKRVSYTLTLTFTITFSLTFHAHRNHRFKFWYRARPG